MSDTTGEIDFLSTTTELPSEEQIDGAAPMHGPPPTLTPTYYDLLAEEIIQDLDKVAAKIPQLEAHHRATANEIRAHINVPRKFLGTAVVTVEETPEIEAARTLPPAEGRETLQYLDAFRAVDDRIAALKEQSRFTLMSRRSALAVRALRVYAQARSLARHDAQAAHHVDNLRRDLGKRGRPKKK